jgi:hypothetical protein
MPGRALGASAGTGEQCGILIKDRLTQGKRFGCRSYSRLTEFFPRSPRSVLQQLFRGRDEAISIDLIAARSAEIPGERPEALPVV